VRGFEGMLKPLAMQAITHNPRRGDGHLWMISLAASLLVNACIVLLVGLVAIRSAVLNKNLLAAAPPPEEESVVMVYPDVPKPQPEVPQAVEKKRLVRTSPDQAAPTESKDPVFIGERSTEATSDRSADATAPPLPSQNGIKPENGEIETTESRYQDGRLTTEAATASPPEPVPPVPPTPVTPPNPQPAPPTETTALENPEIPGTDEERSVPPPPEKLMEGPNPVDVQVPREITKDETIKPTPGKRPRADETPPQPLETAKPVESPKPKPAPQPEFKGFQRKTALVGSINRTGRSALDVEDSALGRYGIAISRAVELEFQRNCVRHRDYITPGFLTVRFYVESTGKVRSVHLDGDMSTGEIQKGFTLNSIRNAEIPSMPKTLGREYAKEPLELVFRFYF
jgi:hypothetical protein